MKAKTQSAKIVTWRFYGIAIALFALLAAIVFHLASIQVLPNELRGYEFLQRQGLDRTLRSETIPGLRGVITDRHGEPLAISTPVVSLWANPKELLAAKEQWPELAKLLVGVNIVDLEKKLKHYRNKEFMYLRRHLTPADAAVILGMNVNGVYAQQEYRRFYPAGEVTSHIVGFTNVDDKGQEGIELAYDSWLAGVNGKKQVLKDLRGRTFKDVSLIAEASAGKDIVLSIDLRLQYLAYKELKEVVKAHRAISGSIVLLDVVTGEVLAMANQPSYNPNDRSGLKPSVLRNRAMTDQFEPGSTMKPLTIMAALETGRFHPSTEIDTHPGYLQVGRKTLLDPVNYGVMSIEKILKKSSQVGLTKIGLDLDGDSIRDMFFRVGLGQDTGTGFPGEAIGRLPSHSKWQPIVQANYSFGYGISVTALQLAQAYSVIADSGRKKPVSLLKVNQVVHSESVVEPHYANQVATMLQGVVKKGGTGTRASIPAYQAAGKTGTIHKVGNGGYADDRYLSLFAGFAPAEDPRLIAVVVINEPKSGQYFGGEVAAPVFSTLVERSLRLLQVRPKSSATLVQKKTKNIIKVQGPLT
ncbi:MAG: cell division protein FtsI (penicillin-binding protein 3) [Cellvibrionaceae bacterium]|jgi:cell division protein FtsI (penicillin-binding protein 3)